MFDRLIDTLGPIEAYDLALVLTGLGVLALSALFHRFERHAFSFPLVPLLLGVLAFLLPLPLPAPDPAVHGTIILHLTEIGVVISLMGVGLKLDRLPGWRSWSPTWRLLAICMPLTIAGIALLGWWMVGLAPASALLLGAALAPTDPVLASDVQVGEPDAEEQDDEEKDDELRFVLTSEAGLNDSLAFPFTFLAIFVLGGAPLEGWLGEWFLVDVLYRLAVGIGVGLAVGWGLSWVLLRLPVDSKRQQMTAGVGALAATLLLYGTTEAVHGYGFIAVFVGAMAIKHRERPQKSHEALHRFAEQSEQLLMTGILIGLGGAIAGGLLTPLTGPAALLGIAAVFVIRPLSGWIGMVGEERLPALDRMIASFFGIRGVGSLFYLAYGLQEADFPNPDLLWATCAFTIVLSVGVHGMTAAPAMAFRDRRRAQGAPGPAASRSTGPE